MVDRVVRDRDNQGSLIWIPVAKTINGRRVVEVPALLRPYLLRQALGKQADELLFPRTTKSSVKWLFDVVKRICRLVLLVSALTPCVACMRLWRFVRALPATWLQPT